MISSMFLVAGGRRLGTTKRRLMIHGMAQSGMNQSDDDRAGCFGSGDRASIGIVFGRLRRLAVVVSHPEMG